MEFVEHLKKYLPKEEINKLMDSFSEIDKKAIYINENKISKKELLDLFPNLKPHPVVPNGYLFDKNEYQLGKKIYHELGCYYIQEPSAMLVAHFLDAKKDDLVLDLCAAPGGKTIQTALKMQNEGLLIANDLSKSRANILLSNIERLGIKNTVVSSLDFSKQTSKFDSFFDKIILDAPCSGSGMFRKSEEMSKDWTYEKVLKNAAIQKELITMSYKMLKPGGTIVYSTCSYSFEEDEEVIEHLLQNSDAYLINIPSFKGEYRSLKYKETVHLFPSRFEGEGHYIALIGKPGESIQNKFEQIEIKRKTSTISGNQEIETYILYHKLPNSFESLCLRPGLFKSILTNAKEIPSHHFSHAVDASNSIELTKEEVIKYLHGDTLNKKYPNGYFFVSYKNVNLGVVYSINGTLKNLYPKGLRFNATITETF